MTKVVMVMMRSEVNTSKSERALERERERVRNSGDKNEDKE